MLRDDGPARTRSVCRRLGVFNEYEILKKCLDNDATEGKTALRSGQVVQHIYNAAYVFAATVQSTHQPSAEYTGICACAQLHERSGRQCCTSPSENNATFEKLVYAAHSDIREGRLTDDEETAISQVTELNCVCQCGAAFATAAQHQVHLSETLQSDGQTHHAVIEGLPVATGAIVVVRPYYRECVISLRTRIAATSEAVRHAPGADERVR